MARRQRDTRLPAPYLIAAPGAALWRLRSGDTALVALRDTDRFRLWSTVAGGLDALL